MGKLKVQYNVTRTIKDLVFWEKNPNEMRQSEMDALKKSIVRFGFIEPIIIDEKNAVLGGNHRATAWYEMHGWDGVIPCTVVSGLSQEDKDKLGLALNKIHGENNPIKLKELLESFESAEDLLELNFLQTELEDLDVDIKGFSTDDDMFSSPREIKSTEITCPKCGHVMVKTRDNAKGKKNFMAGSQ